VPIWITLDSSALSFVSAHVHFLRRGVSGNGIYFQSDSSNQTASFDDFDWSTQCRFRPRTFCLRQSFESEDIRKWPPINSMFGAFDWSGMIIFPSHVHLCTEQNKWKLGHSVSIQRFHV
jgi:hypothetical protein